MLCFLRQKFAGLPFFSSVQQPLLFITEEQDTVLEYIKNKENDLIRSSAPLKPPQEDE